MWCNVLSDSDIPVVVIKGYLAAKVLKIPMKSSSRPQNSFRKTYCAVEVSIIQALLLSTLIVLEVIEVLEIQKSRARLIHDPGETAGTFVRRAGS